MNPDVITAFDAYQTAVTAGESHLAVIRDLDPADVTAEQHRQADELMAAAVAARQAYDQARSVAQLGALATARADLSFAGQWIGEKGLVPGMPAAPKDEVVQLHEIGRKIFAGESDRGSVEADLRPAHVQRLMIRAGYSGDDIVRAAQRGEIGMLVGELVAEGQPQGFDPMTGEPVKAAIGTGSGIVPTAWSTMFYDYRENVGGLRRAGALVTVVDRGNTMTFYVVTDHSDAAGATTEAAAAAETNDSYGSYAIATEMYTGMAYVSRQVLEDAGPAALLPMVENGITRVITRKSETAYHTAFLAYDATDATTIARSYDRTTTAGATSSVGDPKLSRANILDAIYGLDEDYLDMPGTGILTKSLTYRHLLELTLGASATAPYSYVYSPDARMRTIREIEGYDVTFDRYFPSIAAATSRGAHQPALAVGNFNDAFHIMDVGTVQLDVSRHYRFPQQQLTILGSVRTGGAIRDTKAARLIVTDGST